MTTIEAAFIAAGLDKDKARRCAEIHAQTTCDGVLSHGVNRVPRFVDYLRKGLVDSDAEPQKVSAGGAIEVYDGRLGVGITNALFATDRAIALAREQGMGLVALRNTTHWMRGGTYGWRAAEAGLAMICWTNTEAVMPSWGSKSQNIGNNPLVLAVPRADGAMVLDMAMSQFSYGKLQTTRLNGKQLPIDGGFDAEGNLTRDPAAVEATRRILPTGYWKGSGLAIMLDALSVLLSQGTPTHEIDAARAGSCGGSNQVYIAFDPNHFGGGDALDRAMNAIALSVCGAEPDENGRAPNYPGQSTLTRREQAGKQGVEVDDGVWNEVRQLAGRA